MATTRNRVVAVAGAGVLALASTLLPSLRGTEIIKEHEGLRTSAYYDSVRVPTICYGSTGGVRIGDTATKAECDARLLRDLGEASAGVSRAVQRRITQGQYDALVSLTFNIGTTALAKSTLVRKLNAGDCLGAAREFDRWVYAKGKRLNGLVSRRAAERRLFEQGCSAW